jgi:hypothetical protein
LRKQRQNRRKHPRPPRAAPAGRSNLRDRQRAFHVRLSRRSGAGYGDLLHAASGRRRRWSR